MKRDLSIGDFGDVVFVEVFCFVLGGSEESVLLCRIIRAFQLGQHYNYFREI